MTNTLYSWFRMNREHKNDCTELHLCIHTSFLHHNRKRGIKILMLQLAKGYLEGKGEQREHQPQALGQEVVRF